MKRKPTKFARSFTPRKPRIRRHVIPIHVRGGVAYPPHEWGVRGYQYPPGITVKIIDHDSQ